MAKIVNINKKIHNILWNKDSFNIKITFQFDDNIYSTIFNAIHHKNNTSNIITINNGCIQITLRMINNTYKKEWTIDSEVSGISKNTKEKQCFSPVLTRDTLPPGVSMTDLLQVFSTKLKTVLFPDETLFGIYDFAKITKSTENNNSKMPFFSVWRILRGEPAIYDKYGYESSHFNALNDIHPDTFDIIHAERPDIFNKDNGDKTIAELMKYIDYDLKSDVIINALFYTLTGGRTFQDITQDNPPVLDIKTSEKWYNWNKRIKFIDVELIGNIGGLTGGKRKRTHRKQRR